MKEQSNVEVKELRTSLSSILFNNKRKLYSFYIIVITAFVFYNYIYLKSISFPLFVLLSISILFFLFFLSPRKLILNQETLQYHIFWKEKWTNILNWELDDNGILTVNTIGQQKRVVKRISGEAIEDIRDFILKKTSIGNSN